MATTRRAGRKPPSKNALLTEPSYLCPYCMKTKKESEFYVSSDSLVLTGKTVMCKECAEKIARNWDDKTETFGEVTKLSMQAALERLDKPYLEKVWRASVLEATKENSTKKNNVWGAYIKNLGMPHYRYIRWRDGDLYEVQMEEAKKIVTAQLKGQIIPITQKDQEVMVDYKKNQRDVIRLIGYDPFDKEPEGDKPLLYSQLIGYLDTGGDGNEDMMRISSAITIVRGFSQQAKIDDKIAKAMQSSLNNTNEIKTLLDAKQKISSTIAQLAEQSCLSLKHNKNASKGENTFTGKTKRLKEMNLREMENNAFDIGTCEGMRMVADISNASILKQIHLDENDYTEMLAQQREMIVKMQRSAEENAEKARILMRENNDLKKYIKETGIDISEFCTKDTILYKEDE